MFRKEIRVFLTLLAIAVCLDLAAAPPKKPKPPPLPTIADFNKAMIAENYADAQKIAGVLLQTGNAGDRAAVSFAYGRILLAQGEKKEFREYRKAMRKLKLKGNDLVLMEVYDAWAESLTGPAEGPIQALDAIVQKQEHCEATAQAADVLAILHLARGDFPSAKRAVDDGLKLFAGYQPMKTAYIEALLRNRLKARASEAQKLYDAAEKLRGSKKFLEAGRLYAQLLAAFPKDPLTHAASFRMGECLVGLNRPAQAMELWRKFLKETPAGPWRGQAHVASADLFMEQVEVAAATDHIRQAAAILDNLPPGSSNSPEASAVDHSWQDAAGEIRLRQGILALLNQQYEAASAALHAAINSPRPPLYSAAGEGQGVRALLSFSDKRTPLFPAELVAADRGPGLALGLGRIASLMGRHQQAGMLFGSVLSGQIHGASAAQNSFAALGLARSMIASNDPAHAKEAYLLSLKTNERAAWQDQTLRELALLIEQALVVPPLGGIPPLAQQSKGIPPKGGTTSAAEALACWQKLIAEHATSPYAPEALYHAAKIQLLNDRWQIAAEDLEKLVKDYPASPWAGDAHVILIDLKLERLLDVEGAQKNADAAVQWNEKTPPQPLGDATNSPLPYSGEGQGVRASISPLPPGEGQGEGIARSGEGSSQNGEGVQISSPDESFSPFPATLSRPVRAVVYDIYIRAGLLEYVHEQFGAAVVFFEKAKPFAPPPDYVVISGKIPTGIERLIEAAKASKSLTPDIVRKGDATAATALMLADVYHEGQQYGKSLELCNRLLDSRAIRGATPEQQSYAHYKRARNYYLMKGNSPNAEAAIMEYMASITAAPKAPWADEALFYVGNIQWNEKRNLEGAIAVWQRLVKEYPTSKEAPRSALYIGVAHYWNKQYPQARKALEDFVARYPDSMHVPSAKRLLAVCEENMKPAVKPKCFLSRICG